MGWREAWKLRSREDAVRDILGDVPDHQVRRIVARSKHPHLRVGTGRAFDGRWHGSAWWWRIDDPHGRRIDGSTAATHAEALAVGLAALEAASVGR